MENFKRIIRPGSIPYSDTRTMPIFCTIEFKDDRLSIQGVEGPSRSGNCLGGCGQIVMHLRKDGGLDGFKPADGWTLESFRRFLSIWDEWHLNDMRPYDAEMLAAGWREKASLAMLVYRYEMTAESAAAKRDAESAAMVALKAGQNFQPTPEQVAAAGLPLSTEIATYANEPEPQAPVGYQRKRILFGHGAGGVEAPERKTLGWIKPSEHPDGLLCRKLREDGPAYGSSWFRQDVPAEILEYLRGLPVADRPYPWKD